MKLRLFKERGQALILIALAGIALFGIAGLAIDGSAKFSDRRHAQNAADTAALAAALKMARDPSANCAPSVPQWKCDALNRALENGYDNDLASNTVQVYNPPTSGTFSDCSDVHFDCNDYVQVIITSHIDTWFMRVLGFQQTTNVVQAVASKLSSNDVYNIGGDAVVALAPDGCALMSQGNTTLTVIGGGMFSNSDDSTCSFKKDTCAGSTTVDADTSGTQGTITMVGGASINTGCPPDAGLSPAGGQQIPFPPPYTEIPEPDECSTPGGKTNTSSTTTLTPGYFDKIPGNGGTWKDTVILTPGVYCVGTEIRTNANEILKVNGTTFGVGPGVFIYIKSGGSFTFNGGSGVQLWGINQPQVDADSDLEPYNGFLLYVAPNYASGTPATCTINGHTGDGFMGSIYAPYCNITINGTSGATGFQSQLVGYTVKFAGGSNVTLNYNASSAPVFEIPLQVGLSR
jgi:hypothetical protein